MPSLRLSDSDRQRLGVTDEWLPYELYDVTNKEAVELKKLGYNTPFFWRDALSRKGEQVDPNAWTGFVWLTLRRHGVFTDITELEFNFDALDVRRDDGEEEGEQADPGKEPEPQPSPTDAGPETPNGT